ncbi:MAG: HPr family phosphocarrier protein [Firmicutes bacterium]|nr:HPr family phosphocarrier protein [Bacillota bacterium]
MKKTIKLTNESGLHARPAGVLVNEAKKYDCDVEINYKDKTVNAKSIMNLLSLGINSGSEISIITNGSDEKKALEAIVNILENELN